MTTNNLMSPFVDRFVGSLFHFSKEIKSCGCLTHQNKYKIQIA